MQGKRNIPLWRNRDYMLLWSGQSVLLVGYSIRLFTIGAMSLGSVIAGALLQTTGPAFTVFACIALLLLIALATTVNRSVRTTNIA